MNDGRAERPAIAVAPEALADFSWEKLFGNSRAVELEIGTGKAAFLLRRARAHPEINFLGIEWANEFYKFAVDRFERWKIPNVRMLRTDAARFVREVCPHNSLSVLHIYHPDPWPKRRHNKRRLFQPHFVAAAVKCLVSGGRIAVQTDHAEYFEQIRAVLAAHPSLETVPFDDASYGVENARLATNFEVKYLREGRAIYQLALRRKH